MANDSDLAKKLGFDNIDDIKAYRDLLMSEIERYETSSAMVNDPRGASNAHGKATAGSWQMRKELLELNQFLMPYLYPKLRSTEYTGDGLKVPGSLKVEFVGTVPKET